MKNYQPIAIVGMGGVFPGAPDTGTFWNNIINGVDAVTEIPPHRWVVPPDEIYSKKFARDKAFSRRAGVLDLAFDGEGFEIDSAFLMSLDPLYHYTLAAAREAFDQSVASTISRKTTGVVLAAIALPTVGSAALSNRIIGRGVRKAIFAHRALPAESEDDLSFDKSTLFSAKVTSLPALLLAKALRLGGIAYTLDAACSSSLYAVKLACDELQSGRADAMLAGGVSRPEILYTQVGFSQLQALSKAGVCRPFDADADGLVVGEGAGIMVLKRLDDALTDGDHIYGLIRGIGLSNDMTGNLLSPESEGQLRAMKTAYNLAGWSPQDVGFVECHGTGTPVGDAVELTSMRTLWGNAGWETGQCPIGSVKSMVGHLLTGAGAAGMIKTLLGFKHNTIPPGVNFEKPANDSPLVNSPFRVLTHPEPWHPLETDAPLRAAVSSFGFGGINAHVLLEKWPEPSNIKDKDRESAVAVSGLHNALRDDPPKVAVIGMETIFGKVPGLRQFQEAVLRGESFLGKRDTGRWKGFDAIARQALGDTDIDVGVFVDEVKVLIDEFHIPPKEISDILPQHLLALKTAAGAMKDAGLPLREKRPDMGVVVGMDFDVQANDYHFRWCLSKEAATWQKKYGLDFSEPGMDEWIHDIKEACSPPLTSSRVVGALGGIMASRIAKQFQLGGPGFVVSCEEASGLRALEIGVRSLQLYETDCFLTGGVDLSGEVRRVIADDQLQAYSRSGRIQPLDLSADGTLPGEGAVALVLKRLDDALANGDRIYGVIKGIGSAVGRDPFEADPHRHADSLETACHTAMDRAFADACVSPEQISYMEIHGSGDPFTDAVESRALCRYFNDESDNESRTPVEKSCALGTVMPVIGHTGATAGLAAFVKAALCLYQEIIPPFLNYTTPAHDAFADSGFYMPLMSHYWLRNREKGLRHACVSSIAGNGACTHVVMEGFEYTPDLSGRLLTRVAAERKRPLGIMPGTPGLFVVEGDTNQALLAGLDALYAMIRRIDEKDPAMEIVARMWYQQNGIDSKKEYAVTIVAGDLVELGRFINEARILITEDRQSSITGMRGIRYSTNLTPVGAQKGGVAFVYPGSGNHYLGMGRDIGVMFPDVMRILDADARRLKDRYLPAAYYPWRHSWKTGWEEDARRNIAADPLTMIIGQVSHGGLMTALIGQFGLFPDGVIGYSLGESAGMFATGAWRQRSEMLERMRRSDLFTTQLAGPCNAARAVWHVPPDEDVDWRVAVVNRDTDTVKKAIRGFPAVYLLIVNTATECVIGGRGTQVVEVVKSLGCEAIFLEGVVTVHCDAAVPVQDAYRDLHRFPIVASDDVRYYSCVKGRAHRLTSEKAAQSILDQALYGFDFPRTIHHAYKDGMRVFLEMGPHNSCSRMIDQILGDSPHLAVSACNRSESGFLTILKFLGTLIAERVRVDLEPLYGDDISIPRAEEIKTADTQAITVKTGRVPVFPALPDNALQQATVTDNPALIPSTPRPATGRPPAAEPETRGEPETLKASRSIDPSPVSTTDYTRVDEKSWEELMADVVQEAGVTADAHHAFLEFSGYMNDVYAQTFALQARLLEKAMETGDPGIIREIAENISLPDTAGGSNLTPVAEPPRGELPELSRPDRPEPAFSREMCMEFAVGALAKVLGPEFAVVDSYDVRVRLPDEPLMLVDRIMSVEGEKGSLGSGKVVTEHDVYADAWYLDGGRVPVCIAIEAGQADLFLCSYLGIDLAVKGKRSYRLLDAVATFHEGLPRPGDVIRYEITIHRFVRQGETYLFFFEFDGFIKNRHVITMRKGCAGFFTAREVKESGGIILKKADTQPRQGRVVGWQALVPVYRESYSDDQIEALRRGDLHACFGDLFAGIQLSGSLSLPGGRMALIHRVRSLDPEGGRYGLGNIQAEADIHPDDWFLTCHFVDDMVMPGTLMYQCCEHTLRVLLLRMGWVSGREDVCFEPVPGCGAVLKCRGPVTAETRQVIYEVEIAEIGYNPEPYVIADAFMYADGERIVMFEQMSLKITGLTKEEIESVWSERSRPETAGSDKPTLFSRDQLLAYAIGNPSEAFGDPYKIFDRDRIIARLPGPPYFFMDRVTYIDHEQWVVKADGWIEAEYRIVPDDWYFRANRQPSMPFAVLLEIALQPCGWLAAYAGSALRSDNDLKFRNLGGEAVQYVDLLNQEKTLTMRARMTKVSESGGMLIQHFDIQVLCDEDGQMVYEGTTYFGFFSKQALARQVGVPKAKERAHEPSTEQLEAAVTHQFEPAAPLAPDDKHQDPAPSLAMPARALLMIDAVTAWIPDGGSKGLGFVRGTKAVDPDEWFFKAHFYQDPVCPGSLGLESFIQLMKFACLQRWPGLEKTHRFEFLPENRHEWIYRGQIIPANELVTVDADIIRIEESPHPTLYADGFLKVDGIFIYEMKNFALRLIPFE
ncbi:MAG: beta-ketoacyl synthase N-terminal-like domain-containing protein [Thermodesulfobacteriota bacterium]|nr:beta-ketoacyl synthase N-terminal-like domain-containing protein [Thermodesulfobacteriota bacterium]